MNESDDGEISSETPFLANPPISVPGTSPNHTFLEVLAKSNGGEPQHPWGNPDTLPVFGSDEQLIESWLGLKKSSHTKRAYKKVGEELLDFIHPKGLKDCTLPMLQHFLGTFQYKAHETIRQKTAIVQSLFSFALKVDYLPKSPATLLPTLRPHSNISNRRLTEEEVFRLIDRTVDVRDNAVIRALYNGGFRVAELLGINWSQIHPTQNGECLVTVLGKGDKQRVVGLNTTTTTQLLKLRPQNPIGSNPVFLAREGNRLSYGAALLIMKKAALKAGLLEKLSPHWLRIAHATHARARGASLELVQETLGHEDISTTRRYVNASPDDFSGRYLGI